MMTPEFRIGSRTVGIHYEPLVVAEIGINHEGNFDKAKRMVDEAYAAGCECVKFQCHVIDDEMIPNDVVPANANATIWEIISRCALTEEEDRRLKRHVELLGMIYLSTPFGRAAADRLERLGVSAYKVGSGECNNYPLIEHIASKQRPVILSTGMNDLDSIAPAVDRLKAAGVPYALLHCTSMYPTPYEKVRLGALAELGRRFEGVVLGLSDHSLGNYTCFAAVALGASILEKHFTVDKLWPGPDVPISIDPNELRDLIAGTKAIHAALGGEKLVLTEELPTMAFAYACVVAIKDIQTGEHLTRENIWVKRPGTGEIKAADYESVLGRVVRHALRKDAQLAWADMC